MLRPLILLCATVAVALAGCGGGHAAKRGTAVASDTRPAVTEATVQLADCNVWHELRPASRLQLLAGMRGVFGGKVDGAGHGYGETLSDDQAGQLLDNACKPAYAGRFKLYKLYGRAAAFTPQK